MSINKISLGAARINAGFTQEEVQDMTGISSKMISKYERGESIPSVRKASVLAELYNIPMECISW